MAPVATQSARRHRLSFGTRPLLVRDNVLSSYTDVYTPEVLAALNVLRHFNHDQKQLMAARIARRARRFRDRERITFLDAEAVIPRTTIQVRDAREGRFLGPEIPRDLQRQWIQGTGPAAKPNAPLESSIRNVAYALLSGADGWMFDGEDALGQIQAMSLDNQRNLKLAIARDRVFVDVAAKVAAEMNAWAQGFFGKPIIDDWQQQLGKTTKIFRARGLHLDDRHIRQGDGQPFSASIADLVMYVVLNHRRLQQENASIVLYLPKIQTAEEAALWNEMISELEDHLQIGRGAIKVYVLIEQLEATFQLMEIRAALGLHFVGFNTGRWDYINSVADAMAWDPEFINPNIDAITMTYGYMRTYEDRVRRAVNTSDMAGRYALWQGGMEPNIPVGSADGVANSMRKAVAGGQREQQAGASGKWVAHWKMVHIVRPIWEQVGEDNQLGREFPPLTYTPADADALLLLEDAPRTIRGARDLLSVGLQYGNAFGQGFQAAALKPADYFGNDDVLYLMEDAATGEIRLSILWEWVHKQARITEDDPQGGVRKGDVFSPTLFQRLLDEEYEKLQGASDRDVHANSKKTTLPIAKEIVFRYVTSDIKPPWYIDLLNVNLNNSDLQRARDRVEKYLALFAESGIRITENLDTVPTRDESEADRFQQEVRETQQWFDDSRFDGLVRLYSARQVVEQRGTIAQDYTVAADAACGMHARLRELFDARSAIVTFGPYSPGQAVVMKRVGIEGIYLGGWATSAKGSTTEDPGADLASYPLSQVPDEAATIVRALLTADKNQAFARARMSDAQRATVPVVDYRPFIIADADTGHGGDAHVRNLIRRFVEIGVPGYHIEDQKPGCKKCGHQGGKVLVPVFEQIKRLNAARFQLDVMRVPGIIVARTDAEAATLLDGRADERDQPFVLGATHLHVPSWRNAYLAILEHFYSQGIKELNGHLLYRLADASLDQAKSWLNDMGLLAEIEAAAGQWRAQAGTSPDKMLDEVADQFVRCWEAEAGLMTFGAAVAAKIQAVSEQGGKCDLTTDEWLDWSKQVGYEQALDKARSLGLDVTWDCELAVTPEGYYPVQGGLEYAIARSLAVVPYADTLWMETATASLVEARHYAEAIHQVYPDQMLAYNLSPSFNWDTTGMTEQQMRDFPSELGKLGFVFNFITYGGHQVDGLASDEFATALRQDGMLALARLQRKLRLIDSPYRTPQTLVGGPRLDGALMASSGRTATTKAMGKGSTQVQHMMQTEVPVSLLENWIGLWGTECGVEGPFRVELRPNTAGSELLALTLYRLRDTRIARIIFEPIEDRNGKRILLLRFEEICDPSLRRKRLMTLMHLYLIHRYGCQAVHYVTPNENNERQALRMMEMGLFERVTVDQDQVIVAKVNRDRVACLLESDRQEIEKLVSKRGNRLP
ncbi:MAG: isocitrate lyase/phosphoenolpyruvate mutase family protein [Pirellulaceae bacterium]